jgi:triosephosphate isomerase (TIM)
MTMRTPLIVGNWKMFTIPSEAAELAEDLARRLEGVQGIDVVLAPPFTSLASVGPRIRGRGIELAAQDLHWEDRGAYTGEISHGMLEALNCRYVIVGHSERRRFFGETDHQISMKVRAALRGGLRPILCVGEEEKERNAGLLNQVITRQVGRGLEDIPSGAAVHLAVAYEPVWAIGTGKAATPEDAAEAHGVIRSQLEGALGLEASRSVRVLYGGSVSGENTPAFAARKEVDGVLVGGASLKAAEFASIVRGGWESRGPVG